MSQPVVTVVIRALNEADDLRRLLVSLRAQREVEGEVEIIVVDNESDDGTADVATEHGARVVTLARDAFSYPKSMNLGVQAASAPIVVLTVGHAVPLHDRWLAAGLRHFSDPNVAGVYGAVLPNRKYGWLEWLLYELGYVKARMNTPRRVRKSAVGVFGATNCMLRRELWEQHHFDERYGMGGEDTAWAAWAMEQGHVILQDADFTVRHSHGLGTMGVIRQLRYWYSVWTTPRPFSREELGRVRGK